MKLAINENIPSHLTSNPSWRLAYFQSGLTEEKAICAEKAEEDCSLSLTAEG